MTDDGLVVTRGDSRISPKTVLAASRGNSRIYVVISDADLPCSSVQKGIYITKGHDHPFVQEIELTPLLGTSGDTKWTITSGIDGKTQPTVVPSATDLNKTVELTVPLLKLKHVGRSGGDEPMTIAGPIVARGCGVAPSANVQPRPQPKLQFSVAQKQFEIVGAVLTRTKTGREELTLATQARDCNASPSADLEWSYALENDRPVALNLFGPLLGNATLSENPEAAKDVHVTIPTPTGSSVQVTIDAAYEVAHYRIALKGTVDALVCDPK